MKRSSNGQAFFMIRSTTAAIPGPRTITAMQIGAPGAAGTEAAHVDPGDRAPRCRLYRTSAGLRGMPEAAWIESALRR
jgi:hypothetical protein